MRISSLKITALLLAVVLVASSCTQLLLPRKKNIQFNSELDGAKWYYQGKEYNNGSEIGISRANERNGITPVICWKEGYIPKTVYLLNNSRSKLWLGDLVLITGIGGFAIWSTREEQQDKLDNFVILTVYGSIGLILGIVGIEAKGDKIHWNFPDRKQNIIEIGKLEKLKKRDSSELFLRTPFFKASRKVEKLSSDSLLDLVDSVDIWEANETNKIDDLQFTINNYTREILDECNYLNQNRLTGRGGQSGIILEIVINRIM